MNKNPLSLRLQVAFFAFARLVLDVNTRMVYPFLSIFAQGMGISVELLSLAVTARSAMGALTPLLTPISDRRGRKSGMLLGLVLYTIGTGAIALIPGNVMLFFAFCVSYLGMSLFVTSMQAYLGDRVIYEQRGRVIALIELGWAVSFIAGIPLVGMLISHTTWQTPYTVLCILGVVLFALTLWIIPQTKPQAVAKNGKGLAAIKQVLSHGPAVAALVVGMSFVASNEVINLVFGVWMEDSFGLKIAALGAASAVIGFAELGGEGLTAAVVDRFGKERSILIGMILTGLFGILLPVIGSTEVGALVGLFLFYLAFEFTVVSMLPLMTQILPSARATMMGLNMGSFALGRALGALIAPFLYHIGFWANSLASLVFILIGLAAMTQVRIQHETAKENVTEPRLKEADSCNS
jgi:predicted MFS family arabinose efflux permease